SAARAAGTATCPPRATGTRPSWRERRRARSHLSANASRIRANRQDADNAKFRIFQVSGLGALGVLAVNRLALTLAQEVADRPRQLLLVEDADVEQADDTLPVDEHELRDGVDVESGGGTAVVDVEREGQRRLEAGGEAARALRVALDVH